VGFKIDGDPSDTLSLANNMVRCETLSLLDVSRVVMVTCLISFTMVWQDCYANAALA
jgi:hypothetical protein